MLLELSSFGHEECQMLREIHYCLFKFKYRAKDEQHSEDKLHLKQYVYMCVTLKQ